MSAQVYLNSVSFDFQLALKTDSFCVSHPSLNSPQGQSVALMSYVEKKPSALVELININLDNEGIKDVDKPLVIIAKGAELS